ncbi:MAG: TRAP transporter small permease [Gammaproteobacteria bacterium]|jgi:TRAP-type C4-dicarboxylate transport system permease small subunit|uniref:TRAP transporter small permease protein n=2 Tax=Marinomonas TaxID=28253 RepID=A0A1M4VI27_9GAMM|nr:TRAP transporter small permease [Gammaproteobacteria bacterium]SHE68502.1 TRAP-type C4-dicarboxylate transport system, small permease component [Marinomonas polaris DSM 16579]MBU1468883.1 TRAP transporter small permease [Gammaproteobacteria bacterium]MBU2024345.1 TRAP transporter small permease [Gammaproteobacteria bacterium]MBU2239286.1 TRAP transporter small permease [Gammaproteobacteria bacterium]
MKVSAFLFEDTKMAKFIIKFSRFLNNSALNVSAVLMGLMALLVFYQVITRFVFGAPSAWSEISARVMMVWMVYISMGCVFSRGSMISITFFVEVLPDIFGLWVKRAVTIIVLIFFGVLIWYGWDIAVRVKNQNVAMLNISAFWLYISIPIGAVLSIPSLLEWHILNVENKSEPADLKITKTAEV